MLTTGNIIFACVFAVAFLAAMIWSFRKDKTVNSQHYKHTSRTVVFIVLGFVILFLAVKFRNFL